MTNEAAERLRTLIITQAHGAAYREAMRIALDDALLYERRVVVERMESAIHRDECNPPCVSFIDSEWQALKSAILDGAAL